MVREYLSESVHGVNKVWKFWFGKGSHHAIPILARALSGFQNITPGPNKY